MKNIYAALVKAQSEMSNPKKASANPFFKSKYSDLNAVREAIIPVLNAHGIAVLQPHVHMDGKNFVNTKLVHESGEYIDSFTEIITAKQNDPQALGSATSYARRYGLQSLVCVGADDDDGEAAMSRNTPPFEAKKEQAQPTAEDAALKEELEKLKGRYRKGLSHELVTEEERKKALLNINLLTAEQLIEKINNLGQLIKKRENKQG